MITQECHYYHTLAGYPASLGFPPSLQPCLTASLWYFLKLYNVFNRVVTMHRCIDASRYLVRRYAYCIATPNYKYRNMYRDTYRDQCIAIRDTYHDPTSGASRYVNAGWQRIYRITSVHTTTGGWAIYLKTTRHTFYDAALFAPREWRLEPPQRPQSM